MSVKNSVLRRVALTGTVAVGAGLLLAAGTTAAQATTTAPPPAGASLITLGGAGDQVDSHVSGNLVTYTDFSGQGGNGRIHVLDLATGTDLAIVTSNGSDSLPDVSGTTVTFTHFDASGTHQAYRYDYPKDPATATVVDPEPTADNRRMSRVGGSTFAFQDLGYTAAATSEITGFDATTGVATRLTDDALYDTDPAVSQDGGTAVWSKCASIGHDCHVWQATHGASGWSAPQQLTSAGNQAQPDTDGRFVVYGTAPGSTTQNDEDIAWQPVGGGPEHVLDLPSLSEHPSISNGVIVFDRYQPDVTPTPNFDIELYDIATDTLYQLTDTPEDEALPDVSVSADRTVTVGWTLRTINGDDDVQVERFRLPALPDTVALSPAAGSGQVGTAHTVQARVSGLGAAAPGVPVHFAVTGAVSDTDSCTTDATGTCSITYQGPSEPGSDTITAYADPNGNGSRDDGEPQGAATWTWQDTASTPGDAGGAGQIAGPHGRVSFLFGAHSGTRSLTGGCLVTDPQSRITITCTDATRYVETGQTVRIEGHAWVNGTATTYTITAQDGGSRGHGDTFGIQTASGYSASGSLTSGDVVVH